MELPTLLAKSDMASRWGVTPQVVHNWESRHSDFPKPVMRVQNGKLPLYLLEDVEKYEQINKLIQKRYKTK
ncbi:hypothetical protein QU577_27000 [Priestia megaterium]|uniref:hypothetical protein n=1 Tax=Priestia megaterium TaxID=1404 RepID=UPI0025B13237|nr:hypothetical protein [Priestia megaterium]MDN3365415.1 hypothetical protein [Priestia megaterium]